MTLAPYEGTGSGGIDDISATEEILTSGQPKSKNENSIRKYAVDRQRKLLSIVLKLAQSGAYDGSGTIMKPDGTPLYEADLINLLLYTLSPGRMIKGLSEFVEILRHAGVTPNEILNNTVREMLLKAMKRRPLETKPNRYYDPEPMEEEKSQKRRISALSDHDTTIDDEPERKRKRPFMDHDYARVPDEVDIRGTKRKREDDDEEEPQPKLRDIDKQKELPTWDSEDSDNE